MYKQIIWGIKRPVISWVLGVFFSLLYISALEAVFKTHYASPLYYSGISLLYAGIMMFLIVSTATRYEYAVLDRELILRRFICKKPQIIFAIELLREDSVYYKNRHFKALAGVKRTHKMYLPFFNMFSPTRAIVFTDTEGHKIRLLFKADETLSGEIQHIKNANW